LSLEVRRRRARRKPVAITFGQQNPGLDQRAERGEQPSGIESVHQLGIVLERDPGRIGER
jgi:hypothetical protein